jgi:Domain of unknown function (DUF4878)
MRSFAVPAFLSFLFFLASCKSKDSASPGSSENNIDAARNFIRAALDGKFEEARTFLVVDSVNTNWMDIAERSYQRSEQSVKDGYRTSSINIHKVNTVNDSTTVVIYSNSFKNDHDTLKVIKQGGQWLVDLKYLFDHDSDTLLSKPVLKDTLP